MSKNKVIAFTPELLAEFKAAYQRALDEGKEEFVFADCNFFMEYAKYLIDYLESKFERN